MKRHILSSLLLCSFATLLTIISCGAPSNDGNLDKARFSLDDCSATDTSSCDTAASESTTVLGNDSTNVEAAMIRSSAMTAKGGVDILKLIVDISNALEDNNKFQTMHNVVLESLNGIEGLTDLRSGIESLLPPIYTGTLLPGEDRYSDYYFQLGILQAFESFLLPTVQAQPTATAAVTVDDITAEATLAAIDDFIDSDNNLETSGIDSTDSNGWNIVRAVRQYYCILHTAEGGALFSRAVLQDFTLCQLCIDVTDTAICAKESSDLGPADFKSGKVARCSDFAFAACANAGPTL